MNSNRKQKIRTAVRKRMEKLQCPACHRKGALVRVPPLYIGESPIRQCRYCKHESTG